MLQRSILPTHKHHTVLQQYTFFEVTDLNLWIINYLCKAELRKHLKDKVGLYYVFQFFKRYNFEQNGTVCIVYCNRVLCSLLVK